SLPLAPPRIGSGIQRRDVSRDVVGDPGLRPSGHGHAYLSGGADRNANSSPTVDTPRRADPPERSAPLGRRRCQGARRGRSTASERATSVVETMKRFAFYGRVSTEDQQDPASSRGWQLSRAAQLIEPAGGEVVA